MIQLNRYPGGVRKALTFSYDDGPIHDVRLMALFDKYGMKGTFHINGASLRGKSDEELMELRKRYEGHEIAVHTLHHGDLNRMTDVSIVREVLDDRIILEKMAGYPVVGMSYPSGRFSDHVIRVLKSCGIVYSRTTRNQGDCVEFPEEFLAWHPSCHHKNAMPIAERFVEMLDSEWNAPLLYIWGHAWELKTEENWEYMENLLKLLSGHQQQLWCATNIEMYNYVMAQRNLRISANESMIYNPSDVAVWVERDKKDIFKIEPGQTLYI